MKKVGVVLDIEKNKAVVITNENEYFYLKSDPQLRVGKIINFSEYDLYFKNSKKSLFMKISSIAAGLILILSIWLVLTNVVKTNNVFSSATNRSLFGYIDIYCNANIEFEVDENFNLMNSRGLNDEGRHILNEINIKKENYDVAISKIIEKGIENGSINDKNINNCSLLVSGALGNNQEGQKNEEILNKKLKNLANIIYGNPFVFNQIKILKFNNVVRDFAFKKDISMSLYGILQEGINQGLDLNCDQLTKNKYEYLLQVSTKNVEIYNYKEPNIELSLSEKDKNKIEYGKNVNVLVNVFPNEAKKVELYLDNKIEVTDDSESYIWNLNQLKSGEHQLKVIVYLKNGYKLIRNEKINVKEKNDGANEATNIEENRAENDEEVVKSNDESKAKENIKESPKPTYYVLPTLNPSAQPTKYEVSSTKTETKYSAWDAKKIYNTGDIVSYNGKMWQAQWYVQGLSPGTTGEYGAWKEYKKES